MLRVYSSQKYSNASPTHAPKEGKLRSAIMQRISSSKKTRMHEHTYSDIPQFRPTYQSADNTINDQLKDIVLQNQSVNQPGFYQYVNWMKIHDAELDYVDNQVVLELWKILRVINYGQVCIPTGLVYQLLVDVKDDQNAGLGHFQQILNNFLMNNQVPDNLRSFKELKGYMDLQKIQCSYKKIESQKNNQNSSNKTIKKGVQTPNSSNKKRNQSLRYSSSHKNLSDSHKQRQNVFDRNFKEAERRSSKKFKNIVSNIVQEQKGLLFKPKLNTSSNALNNISKITHDDHPPTRRICHQKEKHVTRTQDQKYVFKESQQIQTILKAKKIDKSLFQGTIDGIPGVENHINRHQYSYAEKLRANRQKERPSYGSISSFSNKKNTYGSLYQSSQKKQHMMKSFQNDEHET